MELLAGNWVPTGWWGEGFSWKKGSLKTEHKPTSQPTELHAYSDYLKIYFHKALELLVFLYDLMNSDTKSCSFCVF